MSYKRYLGGAPKRIFAISLMAPTAIVLVLIPSFLVHAGSLTTLSLPIRLSIAHDMTTGEARPLDVSEDKIWARQARINLGNNPGSFKALLPWAQIFAGPGNISKSADVQIRSFQALIMYEGDSQWTRSKVSPCVSGAYYTLSYTDNEHFRDGIKNESVKTCSIVAKQGRALHFWPATGRTPLTPQKIVGIIVMADARIAPKDARSGARFLMSVGADYWLNQSIGWDHYKTNGDVGIGRLKWLSPSWRTFSMTTISPADMNKMPVAIGSYNE